MELMVQINVLRFVLNYNLLKIPQECVLVAVLTIHMLMLMLEYVWLSAQQLLISMVILIPMNVLISAHKLLTFMQTIALECVSLTVPLVSQHLQICSLGGVS